MSFTESRKRQRQMRRRGKDQSVSYRLKAFVLAIVFLATGFVCCAMPGSRAAETAFAVRSTAPDMSIKSYFREMKRHNRSEPLLVQVTLANPDANNVLMHNQRIDKQHTQSVPAVVLGSSTVPINQLLSVMILPKGNASAGRKAVLLSVSKKLSSTLNLDGTRNLTIYYGLDKAAISKLLPGAYTVRASLDSGSQAGAWKGKISEEFDLELVDGEAGSSRNEQAKLVYCYGKYYLLDHQFDKVEPYAKWLENQDANSIGAAELRGDSALAGGQYQKAAGFFQEAIRRASLVDEAEGEPPVYLHRRWEQAKALLGKSKRK